MGKMNLLNGSIQGKLGETYGYRRKTNNVLSAVPFSHSPHNAEQNAAFSAFAQCQKLSGSVARTFFEYTGLSDKKMLKINAVAHFFKPLVANREFTPRAITRLLPNFGQLKLTGVTVNDGARTVDVKLTNVMQSQGAYNDMLYLGIFKSTGEVVADLAAQLTAGENNFRFALTIPESYYILGFKSWYTGAKWKLACGVFFSQERDVINGVWYMEQYYAHASITFGDGVVHVTDATARYSGGKIIANY